jgi:hypothetical protein
VSCPSGEIFYKVLWTTDSARADEQGRARYSCVWQYDQYPIALVVTGTSASSVRPACDAVTVYNHAQLADRVG